MKKIPLPMQSKIKFITIMLLLLPGLLPLEVCQAAKPSEIKFMVTRFRLEGSSPLSKEAIDSYFKPLQQHQYNLKELQNAGKGLEKLIRDNGYPFYRVILPPQTLTGHEVKFEVVSFSLGEIKVSGNQYFDNNNIYASLPPLKNKQSPNTQELSNALKVSNKHPSKQLQILFKQSASADKVDVTINVADQRPWQASLFLNNAGSRNTGAYRMTGSLQYSNLWGLDHIVNASYTTSPDHADAVKQYGGSYSLPLYNLKAWLSAYYAYSSVNTGTVAGAGVAGLTVTGAGEMYGIHYQQFLPKLGSFEHYLDIGLDNRYFINNVQYNSIPLGSNIRSAPVSILYKGEYTWKTLLTGAYLQWVGNTWMGGHNNQDYYTAVRKGAKQDWNILRYGANFSITVNGWLATTNLIGQYSSTPLIAGEQLGIGGNYDVRGYEQRETSADIGEIVKLELNTPTWQKMNLFAFYDYGHGHMNNALPGTVSDWNLSGIGMGARWQWRQYIMANVAYANALNNSTYTHAGDSRAIANIVLRY